MIRFTRVLQLALLGAVLALSATPATAQRAELPIAPQTQAAGALSWAAVASMVLQYYGYPEYRGSRDYQCGVVRTLGGRCDADCGACVESIGTPERLQRLLQSYPPMVAQQQNRDVPPLSLRIAQPLGEYDVTSEIDARRPVIAAIAPGGLQPLYGDGMSNHIVLIVGYETIRGRTHLIVNDPFPMPASSNPYVAAGGRELRRGQYLIRFDAFAGTLNYQQTLYRFARN